jgi:hypothetical protein
MAEEEEGAGEVEREEEEEEEETMLRGVVLCGRNDGKIKALPRPTRQQASKVPCKWSRIALCVCV